MCLGIRANRLCELGKKSVSTLALPVCLEDEFHRNWREGAFSSNNAVVNSSFCGRDSKWLRLKSECEKDGVDQHYIFENTYLESILHEIFVI